MVKNKTKNNWEENRYSKIFEETCNYIRNRRKLDSDFTISQLEEMIKAAYLKRGNDWVGKGKIKHITDTATIAAYECMLAKWKKEKERLS